MMMRAMNECVCLWSLADLHRGYKHQIVVQLTVNHYFDGVMVAHHIQIVEGAGST
jgi:hypothetical protein